MHCRRNCDLLLLFFKRNDILVDVIIFAKDKAENQKKFLQKKNGGKYGKK